MGRPDASPNKPANFPLKVSPDYVGLAPPSVDAILVAAADVDVAKIIGPLLFLNIDGERHLLPHSYSFIS